MKSHIYSLIHNDRLIYLMMLLNYWAASGFCWTWSCDPCICCWCCWSCCRGLLDLCCCSCLCSGWCCRCWSQFLLLLLCCLLMNENSTFVNKSFHLKSTRNALQRKICWWNFLQRSTPKWILSFCWCLPACREGHKSLVWRGLTRFSGQ